MIDAKRSKAAVVVPFYKDQLSAYEQIALKQCFKALSGYDIIAIKPKNLSLETVAPTEPFFSIIQFDNQYFANIDGYNRLMLSAHFYESFLDYEYILIYQLDAFVFDDQLKYWCEQGFDYIGAPWLRKKNDSPLKTFLYKFLFRIHTRLNIKKNGLPSRKQFDNKVGNGGFSLRRVRKFYELSSSLHLVITKYLSRNEHEFHEDAFWSIEVNRRKRVLNIPGYKMGLKFSIENAPERALRLNSGLLPFGCHAWDKHIDFWRPIFKQLGYII